ncbi:MAG: efflux RND transporter periplasmic adaptor subunit [Bacteroidota bacterium]
MDRMLKKSELNRRKTGRILRGGLLVIGILLAAYGFAHFLQATAIRSELQIATVERGQLQERVSARGTVLPAFEQIVSSALGSEIRELLVTNGSAVKSGDVLMRLDDEGIRNEYEQAVDALELRKNRVFRLQLELDKTLYDLQLDQEIQALQLDQQRARLQDLTDLQQVGGATAEEIKTAQLEVNINSLQQQKLRNEIEFRKRSLQREKENLQLEVDIQAKQLWALKNQLDQCLIQAPRAGVVTWINDNIGQQVSEGDALLRVANLDHFRVEATCSDRFADDLRSGQSVIVRINGQDLNGQINTLQPTAENNSLRFGIQLEQAKHPSLRPNQTVEVFVVLREIAAALQLPNGPAFSGAQEQTIFVVNADRAQKRQVRVGLSNPDRIEILSGLAVGERVIVSNTEDYRFLDQFTIRD